jgi:hypothetical protein
MRLNELLGEYIFANADFIYSWWRLWGTLYYTRWSFTFLDTQFNWILFEVFKFLIDRMR